MKHQTKEVKATHLHHEDILIIEAGLYANASIDVKAI
jgi:hypothetical protein